MDEREFLARQFDTLRDEIASRQNRMFCVVAITVLTSPALMYLASRENELLWALLPHYVLVLIVKFIAEQHGMMRAGRYIREHIESALVGDLGWESWLEKSPGSRLMERQFFGCFILVFFLQYFVCVGVAMRVLWGQAGQDPSGNYWYLAYGAVATYVIGGVWAVSTLLNHWRASLSTIQHSE